MEYVIKRVSGLLSCLSMLVRRVSYFDLYVISRLSTQGCAFWDCRWSDFLFRRSYRPKPQFWRGVQAFSSQTSKT